jgi:hypothetical protein
LAQLCRKPARRSLGVLWWLGHHQPAASTEERRAALCRHGRAAEAAGHNEIEVSTVGGIAARNLCARPDHRHSAVEIKRLYRLGEEARPAEVRVEKHDLEVGSSDGQNEAGQTATAAEVEYPGAIEYEPIRLTCRGCRIQEPQGVLDVPTDVSRSEEASTLSLGQDSLEPRVDVLH